MNIALIHLGNKGGTYHYSKSHIDYLNPKLIVGTRKFKKDFSYAYPNQSIMGLTTYSNLIELIFSSLFVPIYLVFFIFKCIRLSINRVFILDCHPWTFLFAFASRLLNLKVLVVVHDGVNANKNRFGKLSQILQILLLLNSSHLFFLSNIVRKNTFNSFPLLNKKKSYVYPLPPTFLTKEFNQNSQIHKKKDQKKCSFLFFGTINQSKGYDLIYKTFKKIKDSESIHHIDWELFIVGKQRMKLYKIIDKRISYDLRFIDDSEVGNFFQRCNILLLPYQNASQSGNLVVGAQFGLLPIISNLESLVDQANIYYSNYLIGGPDFKSFYNTIDSILLSYHLDQKPKFTCKLPSLKESAKLMKDLVS